MDREVLKNKIKEMVYTPLQETYNTKLKDYYEKNGMEKSLIIAMEECSELIAELIKTKDANDIDLIGLSEEIADVTIALDYVSLATELKPIDVTKLKEPKVSIENSILALTTLQKGISKFLRTNHGLSSELFIGYRETTISIYSVYGLMNLFHIDDSTVLKIVDIKLDREAGLL